MNYNMTVHNCFFLRFYKICSYICTYCWIYLLFRIIWVYSLTLQISYFIHVSKVFIWYKLILPHIIASPLENSFSSSSFILSSLLLIIMSYSSLQPYFLITYFHKFTCLIKYHLLYLILVYILFPILRFVHISNFGG